MTDREFHQEILQHHSLLRQYSRRFSATSLESEDLLHETLLKALVHSNKFRKNTNFKAWMYKIMKNTFINQKRKQNRRPTGISLDDDVFTIHSLSSGTFPDPLESISYQDLCQRCHRLKSIYAIPFQLYFKGYKYFEISDIMNIPIGTVKTRIRKAREILKSQL